MTAGTLPLAPDLYVYVVVRDDLPAEHQLVQACHAALRMGFSESEPHMDPNIVALNVPDEASLLEMASTLQGKNIVHKLFFEPDDDRGHTALATVPIHLKRDRKVFAGLPLVGRTRAMALAS